MQVYPTPSTNNMDIGANHSTFPAKISDAQQRIDSSFLQRTCLLAQRHTKTRQSSDLMNFRCVTFYQQDVLLLKGVSLNSYQLQVLMCEIRRVSLVPHFRESNVVYLAKIEAEALLNRKGSPKFPNKKKKWFSLKSPVSEFFSLIQPTKPYVILGCKMHKF